MLKAPSIATIDGASIWEDDTSFFTFYITSAAPRMRVDKDGDPVFLMVQYALSDIERETNPTLPAGGGYVNFDSTFAPTEAEETAARSLLQPRVNAEWRRLKNGTVEERALPGVNGTTAPPDVIFASPTWTSGQVTMYAPQSEALISAQIASGTPDLMAGNIAVFNMDTTPAGADFMRQTLLADGDGSDLTPIQLAYNLGFWARLPPIAISVTAEAQQIYNETRKFMEGAGVDGCSTYDFQNSDISTSLAEMSGLIEVHIDPGSANVDDAVLEELRQYALDMMQQLIESRFFTDDPSEATLPGVSDEIPIEISNDPAAPTKKWLRESYDEATMNLELNLTQEAVVEWVINPQATLQTFFSGRSEAQMRQFVRQIRLNDTFFQNLDLTARVFANFDSTDLTAVELEMLYEGREADGTRREKTKTFTFTDSTPQQWVTPLIGDERKVRYRWRTQQLGESFGPFTAPQFTSSNALNISIPDPGLVERKILAGDLNWDILNLTSVHVLCRYEDAPSGVTAVEDTIILTPKTPEGQFTAIIDASPDAAVKYKRRYAFANGEVVEDDDWSESISQTIIINKPFARAMEVRLMPVGLGWDEVIQVAVELFYDDGNGNAADDVVTLKTAQDLRVWTVWLQQDAVQNFTYRITASYKDGDFEEGPMQNGSGSGVLEIEVREPRETTIRVIPNRLDFDTTPLTQVVLRHPESNALHALTFDSHDVAEWRIPVRPGDPLLFSAEITHFPTGGDPVEVAVIEKTDPILVLPPYKAPEAGKLTYRFMPTLVDFAATPLVTLDVKYEDEANGVTESESFAFAAKEESLTWAITVKDRNRKLLEWTATYFVAPDNSPQIVGPNFMHSTLLPIPNFKPDE